VSLGIPVGDYYEPVVCRLYEEHRAFVSGLSFGRRRTEGMGPSLTVEEGTTRRVFEAYLEGVLAPILGLGQVIMTDNFSAHESSLVAVEEYGYALMYPSIRPSQRKVTHPHW